MGSVGETLEQGATVALLLFGLIMTILILNANSPVVATERFARAIVAIAHTIAPTTSFAVVIAMISAILSGISASKVPSSILLKGAVFVGVYTFFSLILNYLTAPV